MTTAQRDALANRYSTEAVYGSLHSADAGINGANEVAGAAFTWSAVGGSPGVVQGVAAITVPTGVTVTHAGLWSGIPGALGRSFRDGGILPAPFTGPGTYTLTARYTQNA